MNTSEGSSFELPFDIGLDIVSSLQVLDVLSLSSCSRYWHAVCESDKLWECLFRERWPASYENHKHEITEGWKEFYVQKQKKMNRKVAMVANFLEIYSTNGSVEITHFMEAIEIPQSMYFTFEDVQLLFFKRNLNVVLNLVGLYYCIMRLYVPVNCVMEALIRFKIIERQVCIEWKKLRGRLRLVSSQCSNFTNFSLGDLATAQSGIFWELEQGCCNEYIQILISAPEPHEPVGGMVTSIV